MDNEKAIADEVAAHWGVSIDRVSDTDLFVMTRRDEQRVACGIVNVVRKTSSLSSDESGAVNLPLMTWLKGAEYSTTAKLPFVVLVHWFDGIFFHQFDCDNNFQVKMGDTGKLVIHIPTHKFQRVIK